MQIRLSTTLNASPEWVATELQRAAVFRPVAAPLLQRWGHRIDLAPLPGGRTLYTEEVWVAARALPWLVTPILAAVARVSLRYRQWHWRRLAHRHGAPGAQPTPLQRRQAFEALLQNFARHTVAPVTERWRWLEATHVLGQTSLPLHWRSHTAMLRYALHLRDHREALGQVLRLALTPLGHLLSRLPLGNIGRSHVNAFQPMLPAPEVTALIAQALEATALTPAERFNPGPTGRSAPRAQA